MPSCHLQYDLFFFVDDLIFIECFLFSLQMKNIPSKSVKSLVDNMINILGLGSKRKCYSHALSGGQKRKLSVGIALMGDAKVNIIFHSSHYTKTEVVRPAINTKFVLMLLFKCIKQVQHMRNFSVS